MSKSITRRQMLKRTGVLGTVAVLEGGTVFPNRCKAADGIGGFPRATKAAPPFEVESVATVSQQPEKYHGWPTLARRKNGELLLVCSGGREAHVCPFGRVELMRSRDDGRTWSWPCVVMDCGIDDRDAGVLETASGTILITSFTSLAYADRDRYQSRLENDPRWRAAHHRLTPEQRQKMVAVREWMIRSTDGGLTFSGRYDSKVNSPHGPIQLSDGRLLYAGKELREGKNRIGVSESEDDGRSWSWLAEIPTREGDDHRQYHELHAVETATGRIVAQIRNHNKQNRHETLQTESSDGGRTWSVPHSIGVWGYPSHLLRLSDDRLLMSYGHRRQPLGCQARLSEDNGRTWSRPIVLYGNGTSGDLGYPSTVQLDDGILVTAWYERIKESPKAVLRQARWQLGG